MQQSLQGCDAASMSGWFSLFQRQQDISEHQKPFSQQHAITTLNTACRKWAEIKPSTDLAKYIRTNTTAIQVTTLTTPTAECLAAIITTCKIPISIERFTVLTYQYTQELMERHSEGSSRCASNVTVADCTVQSQIHHHPRICTKLM